MELVFGGGRSWGWWLVVLGVRPGDQRWPGLVAKGANSHSRSSNNVGGLGEEEGEKLCG